MTREEAKEAIEILLEKYVSLLPIEAQHALNMAIKALSAQPFTDEQIQTMQELESAQIEKAYELGKADRPTGHWIEHDDGTVLCECSECHEKYLLYEEHILGRNFCPNCGTRMESDANGSD